MQTTTAELNRSLAPEIKDATEFDLHLKGCDRYTLDNGVEVVAINAGTQEVMSLEWVFYAGNWYEEQNLVAATTNFLLKNGTSTKSAFDINEHFEYYGAFLNRSCYNETATMSLHTPVRHLQALLPVVSELLTDAVFPASELQIYRQNAKQRLAVNLKKCDFVASRLIDAYVFGEHHPYGTFSRFEDYDALQEEQLRAYYDRFYRNGRCIIFAAGLLPQDLPQLLNQAFGQLPLNRLPLPTVEHPFTPATEKKYRLENDPNGVQGAIRMARPFPTRHHPDFTKVQVLNALFGGFFGSRLMSNIREDKGYTYGIHSYIQNHLHDSAWMISTEAGRDVCEATIQEVYYEMEHLRDEPVDAEELQLVRNYLIGSILGDLDGPFQVIARWKNILLNGLDVSYFHRSVHDIKNTSAEELQALANKYLQPDAFYELVVV
ncbi:MAG TPA: pitrilysin family protein [Lacibacter sp.]|nr:pitrilysin family protein [Lacibacter sp.]HMO90182.1 pitrilysin family protein [Lacibacter sp.]